MADDEELLADELRALEDEMPATMLSLSSGRGWECERETEVAQLGQTEGASAVQVEVEVDEEEEVQIVQQHWDSTD
jgi:hypothetical protein